MRRRVACRALLLTSSTSWQEQFAGQMLEWTLLERVAPSSVHWQHQMQEAVAYWQKVLSVSPQASVAARMPQPDGAPPCTFCTGRR